MFSFPRLTGADPVLGVEMRSTGEVACFGHTLDEALFSALESVGFQTPQAGVLLSLGTMQEKYSFLPEAQLLQQLKLKLYATRVTAEILEKAGLQTTIVEKNTGATPNAIDLIEQGKIDFVINIPRTYDQEGRPDGFLIRRRAVECGIPLITDIHLAAKLIKAMQYLKHNERQIIAYRQYQNLPRHRF